MAAGFRIDASWLDALDRYVEGLQASTIEAADAAVEDIHQSVISYAKTKPAWVGIADNIQRWSQDGTIVVGVQGDDMVSQAMALEYGDMTNPPDSLFRTLEGVAEQSRARFRDRVAASRPIVIPGVKL